MILLSFITTLLLNFITPNAYICDSDLLNVRIYNNQNGDFTIIDELEKIDLGAFVVLSWRDLKIMLPRSFKVGEYSFTDRRWFWVYESPKSAKLKYLTNNGKIIEYECLEKT